MKKPMLALPLLVLVALATLSLASCAQDSGRYEFSGTWAVLLNLQTWDFGDNGGSLDNTLFTVYSISFDYVTVDENANHIKVKITSVSGAGASSSGYTVGVPAYITYSLSGKNLYTSIDTTDYPTAATDGPFTKK